MKKNDIHSLVDASVSQIIVGSKFFHPKVTIAVKGLVKRLNCARETVFLCVCVRVCVKRWRE